MPNDFIAPATPSKAVGRDFVKSGLDRQGAAPPTVWPGMLDEPVPRDSRRSVSELQALERLRQERETFDQAKVQDARWFMLRLLMGYSITAVLLAVAVLCGAVILDPGSYPETVVQLAATTLLVDLVGLAVGVFKVVLPYNSAAQLKPVTKVRPN